LDAKDRPGATADTSAAKPAVSAAVPAITQRRVRPTRASAASRISAARDGLLAVLIDGSLRMFGFTIGRENQRSIRAVCEISSAATGGLRV
jgi:hypothetical protein